MRQNARPREHFSFASTRSLIRAGGVALFAFVIAGAGFAIGLRAGEGEQPDHAGDLQGLIARSGGALVYSEFGENADTIWAASPSDPQDRIALGAAPHAANFGVQPSLSPDGNYVAYTAASSRADADLWLLEIASGTARVIAAGVDLQTPVWSKESDAVAVSRSTGDGDEPTSELLRVDLAGAVIGLTGAPDTGLYPIEFDASGALYYASLSVAGTDLIVADAGDSKPIAHLSDGIARDWAFSTDGKRLAYLAPRAAGGFAASVLDLATGESAGTASGGGAEFNPIWAPDGSLTVGRPGQRLDSKGIAGATSDGFDVPLSWALDGSYLVVRHFEGATGADPGPSWLWAIDADGQRRKLSDISDVVVAGWLEPTP